MFYNWLLTEFEYHILVIHFNSLSKSAEVKGLFPRRHSEIFEIFFFFYVRWLSDQSPFKYTFNLFVSRTLSCKVNKPSDVIKFRILRLNWIVEILRNLIDHDDFFIKLCLNMLRWRWLFLLLIEKSIVFSFLDWWIGRSFWRKANLISP